MKDFFLRMSSSLTGGILISATPFALILIVALTILGFQWGMIVGFVAGTAASIATWNAGAIRVPQFNAGVLTWLGARQLGEFCEVGEGVHWLFPGLMGVRLYDMRTKTDVIQNINVGSGDKNVVSVDLTIQWKPKRGQLFHFGNFENERIAFESEARQIVRVFAAFRQTMMDVFANTSSEWLRAASISYMRSRAQGKLSRISITETGEPHLTELSDIEPWGLEIVSISIPRLDLPKVVINAQAVDDAFATFAKRGINKAAALNAALQLHAPGVPPPVSPVMAGLEEPLSIIAKAFGA
jgi:regulator of protease activity HflC (stomatin/prohibitin superfamily)